MLRPYLDLPAAAWSRLPFISPLPLPPGTDSAPHPVTARAAAAAAGSPPAARSRSRGNGNARARRDEMADDDILLQPQQVVPRAADRRVGQHARGLLERCVR